MTFILDSKPSIANHYIAELRDVNIQQDRLRFRRNMERLGEILAYELSKTLEFVATEVETPLGAAHTALSKDRIVIATILRAGLSMHKGLQNYFDKADNAFISAYRKHHKDGSFEIALDYISCPNLTDCTLIISDPMLATGASMDISIQELRKHGIPKDIHIVTAIASRAGLEFIEQQHPNAHLWIGSLDEELTAKSYIVPGLGDAGDLAYGPKVQE
jgi:uracil phosphoribosyltransferase